MRKFTRTTIIILLVILNLFLTSCDFSKQKVQKAYDELISTINFDYVVEDLNLPKTIGGISLEYSSADKSILTNEGKITQRDSNQVVKLFVTFLYNDNEYLKEINVTVIKEIFEFGEAFIPKDMQLIQDKLQADEDFLLGSPSQGDVKALVIPIDFAGNRFKTNHSYRLNQAFFGPAIDTGWESVTSYYKKTSYNKLNISGTVTDIYSSSKRASYFTDLYNNGEDADYILIKEALEFLDPKIDFSEYDTNNDGYIDALYFIYSTPVYYGEPNPFNRNQSDLWWAYVYQYFTDDFEYYDGVEVNYYLWAGYDFIDEAFIYDDYKDEYININASTYIHETGHLLGLEDYYDYDETKGPKGGLGGADMMDYTVGDHSSFSKIMMGWTSPYIASNDDFEIRLRPFEASGDVILVTPKWNNSYFDEYFLIDYYTPTGLNEGHAGFNGLFSKSGIRIYHINSIIDPLQGRPKNDNNYYSIFSYNNSDTSKRLISLIEADANNSIEKTLIADDSDLFQAGQIFGATVHKDYKLHNGTKIDFTIRIVSITPREATIRIVF